MLGPDRLTSLEMIHIERVSLLGTSSRDARRSALQTIFNELGASSFHERRAVLRSLTCSISHFAYTLGLKGPPSGELNKWRSKVLRHADALAVLVEQAPDVCRHLILEAVTGAPSAEVLRSLSERCRGKFLTGRGRPEDRALAIARLMLLGDVERLYFDATGKQAAAGRRHYHYAPTREKRGRPNGPFFRLASAVFVLAGEQRGEEAIFNAIRTYVKDREEWRKLRARLG